MARINNTPAPVTATTPVTPVRLSVAPPMVQKKVVNEGILDSSNDMLGAINQLMKMTGETSRKAIGREIVYAGLDAIAYQLNMHLEFDDNAQLKFVDGIVTPEQENDTNNDFETIQTQG